MNGKKQQFTNKREKLLIKLQKWDPNKESRREWAKRMTRSIFDTIKNLDQESKTEKEKINRHN